MATWRRDGRLTGSQRLLCAGLAGSLSLSLTAPLELATVLAQVGVVRGRARGPWAAGLRVWRTEGPRALWKGNAVACLRLFPCSAVQLTAYRKCCPFLCWLPSSLHEPGENLEWTPRSILSLPELCQCLPGCCRDPDTLLPLRHREEKDAETGEIVPYFGVMFSTFEFCKRICLYQNGYIMSPLSYKLTPGVDQSLKPQELRELKKFFKTGQLKSKKPTL